MSTKSRRLTVGGIAIEVVRKDIKNLHLGVYPPGGRVRVASPRIVSDEAIRLAVIDKLAWIKRQREQFRNQPRQSQRDMVNGESHFFLGRRYRLRVHEEDGPAKIILNGPRAMDLYVRPGASTEQRELILRRWQRTELRALLAPMLDTWQAKLNVHVARWGIKKMKTKWGSCNSSACRVWFNLDLAKKPATCIEYIVVHELMHLKHRLHDRAFLDAMDRYLPNWQRLRAELNRSPLGHESWPRITD
jgi:predicted metal-dependent hydrolase